jgi:hypothetical protein
LPNLSKVKLRGSTNSIDVINENSKINSAVVRNRQISFGHESPRVSNVDSKVASIPNFEFLRNMKQNIEQLES